MINSIRHTNHTYFTKIKVENPIRSNNNIDGVKLVKHSFNDFRVFNAVSFTGLVEYARLKAKYPQDHIYRQELANNVGCKVEQLQSVMGADELRDLLKKLQPQDFALGMDFKNVKAGLLRANLHMHTTDSDGKLTIEELLNKSAAYAKIMKKPPLYIAVTNHDVLNDAKKAIELIAKNPEKHKNIRLVPGVELTAQYKNDQIFSKPVQLEVLSYCINPFDKRLNTFIDRLKDENLKYADEIVADLSKQGLKVDLDELKKQRRLFELGAGPAFLYTLQNFLVQKAEEQGINRAIIFDRFKEHVKEFGNMLVTRSTPAIEEIGHNVQTGILSIAHPGRYEFLKPLNEDDIDPIPGEVNEYILQKGITPEVALKTFFSDFKANRGEAVEINYDYTWIYDNPDTDPWLLSIKKTVTDLGLLHGGGVDTHSKNIFKQRW